MMKLKKILAESNVWDRKFGEPLPTLQLNEKKELEQSFIDDIADDTDHNNHNEARIKISKKLGNKRFLKFYEAMEILNGVFNGDGPEQSKLKQKMEKELYKDMSRTWSNYDDIHGAL